MIHLPHSATRDDVAAAYRLAYDLGCKGVTIYRDSSRASQVLAFGKSRSEIPDANQQRCPECSGRVVGTDGCKVCSSCGWSVC